MTLFPSKPFHSAIPITLPPHPSALTKAQNTYQLAHKGTNNFPFIQGLNERIAQKEEFLLKFYENTGKNLHICQKDCTFVA